MESKIKKNYISKEFIINLGFSFAIFAFLFSMRALLKIFQILSKGTFSAVPIFVLFILTFFTTFNHIIPLAFLYSSMALFARLSMDRELLVFSSSGISSLKVLRPIIIFAVVGTLFLLVFDLFLLPEISFKQRNLLQNLKLKNPLSLIQEKNVINGIPGITIYFGKVYKDFRLEDISIIYTENQTVNFLNANSGSLSYDRKQNKLLFKLSNGNIVSRPNEGAITNLSFKQYSFLYSLPTEFISVQSEPKISERHLTYLLSEYGVDEKIEVNKRIIFGIMPFLFIFIGSGLGYRVRQKNKVLHIGLGGIVGMLFFQLIFVGELLAKKIGTPYLIWASMLLSVILVVSLWKKEC
ncbi:LptF/LptG family permease [bacterium]|nr:LptF/LptG family permease [bacterium]